MCRLTLLSSKNWLKLQCPTSSATSRDTKATTQSSNVDGRTTITKNKCRREPNHLYPCGHVGPNAYEICISSLSMAVWLKGLNPIKESTQIIITSRRKSQSQVIAIMQTRLSHRNASGRFEHQADQAVLATRRAACNDSFSKSQLQCIVRERYNDSTQLGIAHPGQCARFPRHESV